MAPYDDDEFAAVDAGSSITEPKQCSALRKNGYMVIKDRPCKIVDMSTAKTGKHGSAKCHIVGIDIFTGKKHEDISPSTHTVQVPIVVRKDYQLMEISNDGYLSLIDDNFEPKEDVKLPEGEIGTDIKEKYESKGDEDTVLVSVVSAMNEEHAVGCRITTAK